MSRENSYVPALHFRRLSALYDPLVRFTTQERYFRRKVIELTQVGGGHHVLDIGCGTGTQIIMLKKSCTPAVVFGLDYDRDILELARRKIVKGGLVILLVQGTAFRLPFADSTFDRVISSLVFHHLTSEDKRHAMRETLRILKPGGFFILADFGKPASTLMRFISSIFRRLEDTEDNLAGRLPLMMQEAGFQGVELVAEFSTLFGTVAGYKGVKGH